MTDAGTRDILDADRHLMKLDGLVDPFIDPSIGSRLRRRSVEDFGPVLKAATSLADHRRSDPSRGAETEERQLHDEGWRARGACDPRARRRVLDRLGFRGPLVFATFASALLLGMSHRAVRAAG